MTVIVPYHFIPLSKWVHLPDWGHLISHDIPFEDGLCGSIKYNLKNHSPLLVGGHHHKNSDESTTVHWAKDAHDKPVIPGSSIKGMLRSVMEVATFSKMGVVEDKSLAYRDFQNPDYKKTLDSTKTVAGWIKYSEKKNKWTYKTTLHSVVFDNDINKTNYPKSNINHLDGAVEKYEKIEIDQEISFDFIKNSKDHDLDRTDVVNLGNGSIKGNVVFTDKRVKSESNNKLRYNYIFHINDEEYKVIENLKAIKDFFTFHNPDLITHLKEKPHTSYGIPVFFRILGKKIKAIGIAKLPKIAYNYSVKQLINNQQELFNHQASFDMTEGIMGCIRDHGLSLKSRLSFTDARIKTDKGFTSEISKVLMSPRESYLAGYIDGKDTREIFRGYNNINNKVKGMKVYPRNKKFDKENTGLSKSMVSKMQFLNEGSEFSGEIFFHNLKPTELGALLWCLTFGEDNDCCHGLGHAKPFGAGNVQIELDVLDITANNPDSVISNISTYIEEFNTHMNEQYFAEEWLQSPQIDHLLDFAKPSDANLSYMDLEQGWNSYNECKSRGEVLSAWDGLERNESTNDISLPSEFKAGRLNLLFDDSNIFDRKLKKKDEIETSKIKQKSIQDLPEYQQYIIKLLGADETVINNSVGEITKLLKEAIDPANNWEIHYYKELLRVVLVSNFLPEVIPKNKLPKMRYNKKKKLVDKLIQRINVND